MTSKTHPEVLATDTPVNSQANPTAGRLLREARLHAGMHLAVLSVTLKVPIRELEALEADELDMSKGPAFYRALSASICRHLRVDPANILSLLPPATGLFTPTRKAVSPVVSPSDFQLENTAKTKKPFGRVFWGALSMLLLIGAMLWVPSPNQWPWLDRVKVLVSEQFLQSVGGKKTQINTEPDNFSHAINPLVVQGAATVDDANTDENPPIVNHTDNEDAVALPGVDDNAVSLSVEADVNRALVTGPTDALQADVKLNPVAPSEVRVADPSTTGPEWVFSATEDSWLEVRNAQRQIVWSGTINADTMARLQSPLPVSVIVGRAEVVTVSFRGQPFDLKPHTRVTVARFEVKE
jgi:cytoskeleton protein RodZ